MLGTLGFVFLGLVAIPGAHPPAQDCRDQCHDEATYGTEVNAGQGGPSLTTLAVGLANAFQEPEVSTKWLQELLERARFADDVKLWGIRQTAEAIELPRDRYRSPDVPGTVLLLVGFERHADGTLKSDVMKVQHKDQVIPISEIPELLEREKKAIRKKQGASAELWLHLKVDEDVRVRDIHKLTTIGDAAGFNHGTIHTDKVTIEIPAASEKGPRQDSGSDPAD